MAQDQKEHDAHTDTSTTGHEWDGIKELDTPLPRWWLWCFYITIVWGIGYTIAYPAWPLVSSVTQGVLGYSSRMELAQAIDAHEEGRAEIVARVAAADFPEIESDGELDDFAQTGGAAIFRTNCSQCHGAGGAGAPGYPNLRDDDWLWGATHEDIYLTVRNGIRWPENDETRDTAMPAFGADGILSSAEIGAVADHVLSLSGVAEASPDGAELFAQNCAACHGDNGEGLRELGAPKLSDGIWLYGGDRDQVMRSIALSRAGVMPAWNTRLTEAQIKQVTHYVHSRAAGE